MSDTPVLFLVFDRPDTTSRVMEAIRAARPSRLYVAADGPRDRPGEEASCEEARRIATAVDWPCDLHTLFRSANLGCRKAVSEAITWFFEHEPEGIILEDDCLPSASFFPFCAALLERFRDDERVMCVTGGNFQDDMGDYPWSYYFSKYSHCWGWAGWRRAWQHYDDGMVQFPRFMRARVLDGMSKTPGFARYWGRIFENTYHEKIDTWDYRWLFSCWCRGGITCTPRTNLISNIGFGADATHTADETDPYANRPTGEMTSPLSHPPRMVVEEKYDAHVDVAHYRIRPSAGEVRLGKKLEKVAKRALVSVGLRPY